MVDASRASIAPPLRRVHRPDGARIGRIIASVPPNLLIAILVAGLLALIPVWRLRAADWPGGWLQGAWLVGFVGVLIVLLSPPVGRFLAPILLLLFIAPYALGDARLRRMARRQAPPPSGVIIDVTPRPRDGSADPDGGAANP
jgi:hypothetical protein